MTGLTYLGTELNGKRLELLREIVPSVRQVALLSNPAYPGEAGERANSEAAAGRVGIDVRWMLQREPPTSSPPPFTRHGERTGRRGSRCSPTASRCRTATASSPSRMGQKIPLVSSWPVFAEAGGALDTYGPRLADSYRRLAYYADRVLRGTRPARAADRAADDDRDDRQPEDGGRARHQGSGGSAGSRGSGDRLTST